MNEPTPRPIVCATDFSERAQHAADFAAELASRPGTTLQVVHGVDERGEFPPAFSPVSDGALRVEQEFGEIGPCQITVGHLDRQAAERGEAALHRST